MASAVRGPTLFSGYWNAPEVNAREFRVRLALAVALRLALRIHQHAAQRIAHVQRGEPHALRRVSPRKAL